MEFRSREFRTPQQRYKQFPNCTLLADEKVVFCHHVTNCDRLISIFNFQFSIFFRGTRFVVYISVSRCGTKKD